MPTRRHLFRSLCKGFYSCRWNQERHRRQDCRKQHVCSWSCLLIWAAVLAAVWLYICMMAYNDRDDVNWKAFGKLKVWVNWFVVAVVLYAALAGYSCLLLLFLLFQIALGEPVNHLHCVHKVLLCIAVLLISTGLVTMSLMWRVQWHTALLSLQATAPFLQLGALGGLTLLSAFVFQSYCSARRQVPQIIIMAVFVGVSAGVFLSPLLITSPCLLDVVPQKPALIGHRGAPMLAPENTMMSFRRSADCNIAAFETDVLFSSDGVPFVMHDAQSLRRTTDVLQKFPELADNTSSSFTWEQLKTLDAGSWFLENDPFHTTSSLSEQERATAKNQTIPSFYEFLKLAKDCKISVIFDMKEDRNDSNYMVDVMLNIINNSGIPHEQVLWLPPLHRMEVKQRAPLFQQVYDNMSDMELNGEKRLNCKYSSLSIENLRELRQRNVTVNLWVVNERWLFSLFWCAGVHSVTTNACHDLQNMAHPVWHLSPSAYMIIWMSADVLSLLLMMLVFYLTRRRRSRTATY